MFYSTHELVVFKLCSQVYILCWECDVLLPHVAVSRILREGRIVRLSDNTNE